MGYLITKLCTVIVEGVTGMYILGNRTERGDTLVQFCRDEYLVIKETLGNPKKIDRKSCAKLLTILLSTEDIRIVITLVATYPGAGIGADPNPLTAVFCFRCKVLTEKRKNPNYNIVEIRIRQTLPLPVTTES